MADLVEIVAREIQKHRGKACATLPIETCPEDGLGPCFCREEARSYVAVLRSAGVLREWRAIEIISPKVGDYCLATKYSDGDPGDAWAVGYFIGSYNHGVETRFLVGDNGKSYRANGYRRVRAGLRQDVGRWLLEAAKVLEASPAGVVNIWEMIGDRAFEPPEEGA